MIRFIKVAETWPPNGDERRLETKTAPVNPFLRIDLILDDLSALERPEIIIRNQGHF